MVEPVSTTAAALIGVAGAGAWLADKLLGPSADALGDQIKIYANRRLTSIFDSAGDGWRGGRIIEPPPAFMLEFVRKASISDEDVDITKMWAGLLTAAAQGYKSRHTLYVDILSQIGPSEAKFLRDMLPKLERYLIKAPKELRNLVRFDIENSYSGNFLTEDGASAEIGRLVSKKPEWPYHITNMSVPWSNGTSFRWISGGPGVTVEHEILIRQQLVEKMNFQFSLFRHNPAPTGECILITSLGIDFLSCCNGIAQ